MRPRLSLTRLTPLLIAAGTVFAAVAPARAVTPPQSAFFSTAALESYSTYQMSGNGDLWPSCWADDDNLYAANGDGSAFTSSSTAYDMAVSRISGTPPNLTGTTLATNVGTNYSGAGYNRKPTGMVCVGNAMYLAFQNLSTDFSPANNAPAASIAKSTDHGSTWTWDTSAPMFNNHIFTTIFFLDFGKNNANAIDSYVYAYGFDNNWRRQQKMYLARVPSTSIQTRSSWQFYTGTDSNGNPSWSSDINAKIPVLEDDRLLYPTTFGSICDGCGSSPVLGQGGVVYDKPLGRYIFTSWSEESFEFYEAPHPWGPWSLFLSKDFGLLRLTQNRGLYGTSIPSKFISADGKTLYVQSNVCCGGDAYRFSLRMLNVQPYIPAAPANVKSDTNNLAMTGSGTTAISKSTHFGMLCGLNCSDSLNNGVINENEDDFDQEVKATDWWGYTWNHAYNINKVVYTTGNMFSDGGWYSGALRVQVRQNFNWVDVSGLSVTPTYPYNSAAGANTAYTFTFNDTWGDGVRIIGTPGGSSHFTSIGELAVYDAGLVRDGGFENQTSSTVSAPWTTEGPDAKGIDLGKGFAHSGNNNAWIRDSTTNWNAITQQIAVQPNTNYTLTGWIRNNFTTNLGYFGVRQSDGVTVLKETSFSALPNYTQLTVTFNSGSNATVKVYGGFPGQGADYWMQLDDISLVPS